MSYDIPCSTYLAVYVISMNIIQSNSRMHWKLNLDIGKILPSDEKPPELTDHDDQVMHILNKQTCSRKNGWKIVESDDDVSRGINCHAMQEILNNHPATKNETRGNPSKSKEHRNTNKNVLNCGPPVNFTEYDSLRGIMHRRDHPSVPEPDVAMVFKKTNSKNSDINMNALEKTLRKAKKEKPKSAHVYNQIGNFWRIKGDTQMSIECFRKALYIHPHHADVLLNLARVLFNLHFLDDAIYLTRRSLEKLAPEQNSWLQHFTLGEILKAYGHFQEAKLHFHRTLELNPTFQPAAAHLREMETSPNLSVTYYTLLIILMLVLVVLCGILSSTDGVFDDSCENSKTHRHFNRAMAMRSMKLGINPKLVKMRKQMAQACN